jgi:hypothetical protein
VPGTTTITADFRSGEIAPNAQGLPGLPEYQSGCRIMQGALPLPTRGFRRIPGTYWHVYTKNAGATPARDIVFYGLAATYTVELTAGFARFITQAGAVVQYLAAYFVLAIPYNGTEIWELQYENINGELYLVHHTYGPMKIKEDTPAPFSISAPTFVAGSARLWNSSGNYPSTIWSHAGRLGLGCTDTEPTLYAMSMAPDSATGTYRLLDFHTGSTPDAAIIGFANDGFGSRIRWVLANRRVAAGLDMTTWMDAGGLPTAANFYIDKIGYDGSSTVRAIASGGAIVYTGRDTKSLRMMVYSQEGGGLIDIDLTKYHDHILGDGVVELASMSSPQPCIFAVRTDGLLAVATIDSTPGNLSWGFARKQLAGGGLVKSACVARQATGDKLWLVTYRDGKYSHEHLEFTKNDKDFTELHYVEAGHRFSGAPSTTFAGLDHLEGKTVLAIGDGASMPATTVTGGSITYEKAVSKLHVGLQMKTVVQPTRPELAVNGTWQAKKKEILEATIRVVESYNVKVGDDEETAQLIAYEGRPEQPMGEPPVPITDDLYIPIFGDIKEDGAVTIVSDDVFPLTAIAVFTKVKILET